jgi:predicted phosphodiesterase
MFDTSYLPEADLAFVVMTDTHHMLDPGIQRIEFESRRHQSARAAHALSLVAALEPAFVVHLGDLVQEFPEGPGFAESLELALAQLEAAGVRPRQVAGNHDVGDKPDPTMPTEWATDATLQAYHERFGPSWTSWDEAGCHFVILNSQIMNGPLTAARQQERWLEADLAAHEGMPTFLFQHLSPFLVSEHEAGLGHYDNIDEPARSWLLDLIRRYRVQMVFAGHSHFPFVNRIGDARSWLVPSTAFTRPGFCEVFSSAPPPERGRDDAPKLGFFLVRVRDGQARVHLIRTSGVTAASAPNDPAPRVVARTTRDLPHSPLGITLRHPLASETEVPIAWQSTVRQPVRNDVPLLACMELGVRAVRAPASDLESPLQRDRLGMLRDEGAAIIGTWIWTSRSPVLEQAARHRDLLDGVELQLPNALIPDDACLAAIARIQAQIGLPVSLAPLLPHEHVPGKQHARTRIGYHLDELAGLDRALAAHDARVDRVLCRVDGPQDPAEAIAGLENLPAFATIGAIDWAVEFADADPAHQTGRATRAMIAIAPHQGARLYFEPLVDLDRTMDAPPGLLDRLCNPRLVFHAVRTLNTVLFSTGDSWTAEGCGRSVVSGTTRWTLALPDSEPISDCADGWRPARLVNLEQGTSTPIDRLAEAPATVPVLVRHDRA